MYLLVADIPYTLEHVHVQIHQCKYNYANLCTFNAQSREYKLHMRSLIIHAHVVLYMNNIYKYIHVNVYGVHIVILFFYINDIKIEYL